jgi:hypothetical protein
VVRPFLSTVAAVSMVLTPLQAVSAAACYTPAEATAVHVRMLQSELMVAALACRDSNPELGLIGGYNEFMHKFSDRLVNHSRALQAHFQKNYGAQGRSRLDAFITSLANTASKQSMTSPGYCNEAAGVFHDVATLDRRDLERFSATRAVATGTPVGLCGAESAATTSTTR